MLKIENTEVVGWEHAIRGMRNPLNSWAKSDSWFYHDPTCGNNTDCSRCDEQFTCDCHSQEIGKNDLALMKRLRNAGTDDRKFMRMLTVYMDITAPLYWWKEFDTYKVGTVANSCSTMHTIHKKEFTLDDFSHEHLRVAGRNVLLHTIEALNAERAGFIGECGEEIKGDKQCWYSMIQLLPTSYNQKRTVMLNYEVLANIYKSRKNHKLDEWHTLCHWIENLPYSELIIGE